MKHLIKYRIFESNTEKYKLFESRYLSINDLDLIEIENFVIDYIDRKEIEIIDINTLIPSTFSISQINQIIGKNYYNVEELNYPDGFKYKSKKVNLFDVLGNSKCIIFKVNLYDDGNRWNLDLYGYTRDYLKLIFGKIENKYNVDGYLIINTNIEKTKPLSESFIILKERENKI